MDRDLTGEGEHRVQCTGDVLWNSEPETCIILLTSVTIVNSIKRNKEINFLTVVSDWSAIVKNSADNFKILNSVRLACKD